MARSTLLLLAPFLVLLAGCGSGASADTKACTAIGCVDGVTLDFSNPLTAAGTYKVVVDADGQKTTCTATLPFAGCAGTNPCSSSDVQLTLSGCALPAAQHSLPGLQSNKRPAKLSVSIERDGQPVAMQSFDVTYTTSTPNGPECGPVCTNASLKMTTP